MAIKPTLLRNDILYADTKRVNLEFATSMSNYEVKLSQIQELEHETTTYMEECLEWLKECDDALLDIAQMESFQGKSATAFGEYASDMHGRQIQNEFYELMEQWLRNITRYLENYQFIDSSENACFQQEAQEYFRKEIGYQIDEVEDFQREIRNVCSQLYDELSYVPIPSCTMGLEALEEAEQIIKELDEQVSDYEGRERHVTLQEYKLAMTALLTKIKSCVDVE